MKKLLKLIPIVAILMIASSTAKSQDSGDLWSNVDPSDHSYDNMYNPQLTLVQQAIAFWANWGVFIMFGN